MQNSLAPSVLDAALQARMILVIGSRDCGKTTFIKHLANELFRQGYSVGVIDSDVGQSDIGPPTTIGFGIVRSELSDLSDAELRNIYFVGSVTPRGHTLSMVLGSRTLLDRALACGLQKILIDTTGFISGQSGRILKQQKIQALEPNLLLCLQTHQECEHILQAYAALSTPEILRLAPSEQCRSKSHPARQHHRRKSFRHYFAQARDLNVSFGELGLFNTNLFTGRPLSLSGQDNISRILSETPDTGTPKNSDSADRQIFWGEYIGEELFLVSGKELQHRQIITLKRHLPAIRYTHNSSLDEFQHLLLGLLDAQGECCGLGILKSIDFDTRQALIFTPITREALKAVQFSSYRLNAEEISR